MKTTKEIYVQLPKSWDDVKLKDYEKITSLMVDESGNTFAGINNTLPLISVLTDTPINELEALPYYEGAALAEKLNFRYEEPELIKDYKRDFIPVDKITTESFITYINAYKNGSIDIRPTLKMVIKDATDESIDEMNVREAVTCFFLLKKPLKKSVNKQIRLTLKSLVKQLIKLMITKFQHFKVRIKKGVK